MNKLTITTLVFTAIILQSCGSDESSNRNDTAPPAVSTSVTVTDKIADTAPKEIQPTDDGKVPPQKTEDNVRLVVSFISRGFGIDHKVKSDFESWLAQRPQVKYDVHPWGKEGELNYCFELENMSAQDQEGFVRDVKAQLAGKQMVFVNENTRCDNWK